MSNKDLLIKLISIESDISVDTLEDLKITEEQWKKLIRAAYRITKAFDEYAPNLDNFLEYEESEE